MDSIKKQQLLKVKFRDTEGIKNVKGLSARLAVVTPPKLNWYQVAMEAHPFRPDPSRVVLV